MADILVETAKTMIGVSVVTGLIAWKKLPRFARLVVMVQIFGFITDIVSGFTTGNNMWLMNSYLPIEVSLALSAGYYVKPSYLKRIFYVLGLISFFTAWIICVRQSYERWASSALIIGYVFIVALFLWQLLQMLFEEHQDVRATIICFCMLFFFSVVIPFFAFENFILTLEASLGSQVQSIIPILNITQSAVLSWTFSRYFRKTRLVRG